MTPDRHQLAWLRPDWPALLRAPLEAAALEEAAAWTARGLPAVVARGASAPGVVALGIALPGRRRLALSVEETAIARTAPPLLLGDALPSAPRAWRAPLRALDARARSAGLALRVYGSLAWQHLSGEAYVRHESDVDLLFRPHGLAALAAGLALLAAHEGPPRLDGEVLLPGGRAVAWRELAAGAREVLVKRLERVALEPRSAALEALR